MKQVTNLKPILASLVALLVSVNVNAHDAEIDGIYYNLVSKVKQATVTYQGDNSNSAAYSGSVTIPSTVVYEGVTYDVTSIGDYAFYGSGLTSVTIPSSVTSIGNHAFQLCTVTSVTIPSSVTSIGYGAFQFCTGLTSVTIPSSVTSIGNVAFECCSGLTSVTIPSSVTEIKNSAFNGCTGLTSVTIEGSLYIYNEAFSGCSNLTTVTLNGGSLGSQAFANCPELLDVYCNSETPPSVESDAFEGSYIDYVTLHVPSNALSAYANDSFWGNSFKEIVTIDAVEYPTSIALTDGETFEGLGLERDMESITYTRSFANTNCRGCMCRSRWSTANGRLTSTWHVSMTSISLTMTTTGPSTARS